MLLYVSTLSLLTVCNAIDNIVEPDSAKAHEHDKSLRKNNRLGAGGGGSRAGVGVDSVRGGAGGAAKKEEKESSPQNSFQPRVLHQSRC
jgi:hypothetical protein